MGMHIGHLALRVPDLSRYVDHVTAAIGLQVLDHDNDSALLATQPVRHELQLIRGDAAGVDHVGLMLDSDAEIDRVVERAVAAGGSVVEEAGEESGCARSVMMTGPCGLAYQLYVPTRRPPLELAHNLGTGLRRFGHLTFLSPHVEDLARFWCEGLGFRVSDEAGGTIWVRCDAYHHSLAVGPHPEATVLHHHAWEIQDIAALAKHCDVNAAAGRPQVWGPVRHGPGFNLATYMPDATGALIEVYSDLLIIADEENYVPIDWSGEPLALNLWGTMPSPEAMAAGVGLVAR